MLLIKLACHQQPHKIINASLYMYDDCLFETKEWENEAAKQRIVKHRKNMKEVFGTQECKTQETRTY
uniref:Uncharacterized protein n=1 Tax=Arundo donax TaxID=35708 RepID=A0A0A9UET8_ARUDO